MSTPSTPEQLAAAIESLVASYMSEVRRAAQHTVERCLAGPTVAARHSKSKVRPRPIAPGSHTNRRTQAELEAECEALHKLIIAQPGESMIMLAQTMGAPASTLQLPMAKLKRDGRVRTVGQRHLMRYFPAVGRASRA